ncbi:MAG: rhamnulokinase [Verrucomicrobia bacterium]|nr:rhamnulokinase [Verrucomicrobiota bacterium]
MTTHYLACDLGATSGRLMLGTLADGKLALEELHRFSNDIVKAGSALHWNMEGLFAELRTGLKKAAARRLPLSSISTDSWGVDYLLFDAEDQIISPTFCYRDSRTAQGVANAKARVSWEDIYAETGIQFMALNTIYQLAAESPARLAQAKKLLLIGDAFNYYCSGVARHEESLASTSQLFNPRTKTWSKKLLSALGLPEALFTPVVSSGTRLGLLKQDLATEADLPQIEVIASCSHDTGAAVAAVPASGEDWAYISSGTWSLIGVELPAPVITAQGRDANFTNEVGYGGTARFLKNIVGMWIVEECRREWGLQGKNYDYQTLDKLTAEAPPLGALINPNDPRFWSPDAMPEKIAAFCRETGQPVPAAPGPMLRCVYESLALLYARTIRQIEQLIGRKIGRLHIVGGGCKNDLLNQFTANTLQVPVLAGPKEATAFGNIVVQAIALGHLRSLTEARELIRRSSGTVPYQPRDAQAWQEAQARFDRFFAK